MDSKANLVPPRHPFFLSWRDHASPQKSRESRSHEQTLAILELLGDHKKRLQIARIITFGKLVQKSHRIRFDGFGIPREKRYRPGILAVILPTAAALVVKPTQCFCDGDLP
jgi:hypothetical protein